MIVIALLITVSLLLWASLGFPGFGARPVPISKAILPAILLLAASGFALAHAAGM